MANIPVFPASVPEPIERGFPACDASDEPGDRYDGLLQRMRAEHIPFSIIWELTHTCNLKCVMCYNVPLDVPELSTGECLSVLDQLAAAGTLRLMLTGGEILSRPDFFLIAERARALGFALDLKTNGTLLTPEKADRMAALDPLEVDISLLGATAETFDAVSGSRNTLARVLRGVKLLQERGVRVKLNTLLLDLNAHEREQMLDLALQLGVYYEQFFKVSPADDGSNEAARHQLSLAEMTGVLVADRTPFTRRAPSPTSRTCAVGLSSCLISPYGVVYPCIELRIPAGDLRRQQFAEIWSGAPIFRQLRARHTWANLPECRVCPINSYCEGRCAGLAWKDRGDMYAAHALACRQAQARFAQFNTGMPVPETPLQARVRAEQPVREETLPPATASQPIHLVGF